MPVELGVKGLVDDPHAATAEPLQYLIVRNALAFHGKLPSVGVAIATVPKALGEL